MVGGRVKGNGIKGYTKEQIEAQSRTTKTNYSLEKA